MAVGNCKAETLLANCILGRIQNKTVDFAVCICAMRESRRKVVDYMVTYNNKLRGYIFVKNPKETFDWDVFGQPFWRSTWILVIIYFMIIPIFMMILFQRRKYSSQ